MQNSEGAVGSLAGLRILAVEDEYLLRLEIATVLRDAGATVTQCATVGDALRALDAGTFAAALLDIRVGKEAITPVAHRLMELAVPFVFYTGHLATEEILSPWPNARVLPKPVAPVALVNAIAELLEPAEPRAHDR